MNYRIVAKSSALALSSLAVSLALVQDKPAASRPVSTTKLIFDKKERDEVAKKLKAFLDPMELRTDAKEREGTDSDKYKNADKAVKTAESALHGYLKNTLAKKYKLDSDCLAATHDWTLLLSDYLSGKGEYKKGNTVLGSDLLVTLRDEPKNTYTRRIPKLYDPTKRSWPVLIMIQEKGKSSKLVTTEEFKLVKEEGKEKEKDAKPNLLFDGDAETAGHIILAIDLPDGAMDEPAKMRAAVLKPLKEIRASLRIDTNRILVGGIGGGVKAAALLVENYPYFFSGFVVKGAGEPGDVLPENFLNTPIYIWGDAGGFSKEVGDGAGGKVKWLDRAKAIGADITVKADGKVDDLAAWASKIVRNPYPSKMMAAVKKSERQRLSVWFGYVPEPTKEVRLEVAVDRDKNEINVQCEGVLQYSLTLSDAIVDLSKPVIIKTNGQERKETAPPNFETLLKCFDDYYAGVDRAELFTSILRPIDVPKKKKSDSESTPPKPGVVK